MALKNNLEQKQVQYPICFESLVVNREKLRPAVYISDLPHYTIQQYDLDPCHHGQLLWEGHEQPSCLYQIFDCQL